LAYKFIHIEVEIGIKKIRTVQLCPKPFALHHWL